MADVTVVVQKDNNIQSDRIRAEAARVGAEAAQVVVEGIETSLQGTVDAAELATANAITATENADTATENAEIATAEAIAASASYSLIQFSGSDQFIDGNPVSFAITDENDRVCAYADLDGVWRFPAGVADLLNSFEDVDTTGVTLDAIWGVRDADGRIAIYIDSNGDYHVKDLYATNLDFEEVNGFKPISSDFFVYCLGDSLTEGTGGTPYPTQLQTLLPFRTVLNGGFAAQNAQQIAGRFGASGITLTVSGDEIPTSGSVNVTITSGNDPLTHATVDKSMSGTIAGVLGTLLKTFSGGQYSFTRAEDGDAVSTSASGEFFFPNNDTARKALNVFWIGRNNVTSGASQVVVVERAVKQVASHLKALQKNFIVMSVLNDSAETTGTTGYDTTIAINTALQTAFPYNFLDIRAILATEPDGTVPASLRSDTIHLNTAGYAIVADSILKFINLKGF